MPFSKLKEFTLTTYQRTNIKPLEYIMNFFKDKCMVMDDIAHNLTNNMYNVPTITELQERNMQKLQKAKEQMGTLYILHPVHNVKRKGNV